MTIDPELWSSLHLETCRSLLRIHFCAELSYEIQGSGLAGGTPESWTMITHLISSIRSPKLAAIKFALLIQAGDPDLPFDNPITLARWPALERAILAHKGVKVIQFVAVESVYITMNRDTIHPSKGEYSPSAKVQARLVEAFPVLHEQGMLSFAPDVL